MKKTIQYIFGLCLLAIIIVVACKKKNDIVTVPTQSLDSLFADLRIPPQNFTVQAGRDTTIYGADSTLLHFYSNSFKDASGNIITSGTISLQLIEMYKPGDMMRERIPTVTADGHLLKSGGQINLLATMKGKNVFANGYSIGYKQSNINTDTMALYYGGSSLQAENTNIIASWEESHPINHCLDSSASTYIAFNGVEQFNNIINCDLVYTISNGSNSVSVTLQDKTFNENNTEVFIAFPTINCVVNVSGSFNTASNTFYLNNGVNVPFGIKAEIVVVSKINGSYYFYYEPGLLQAGMNLRITPSPETRGDIIARLAGL